MRNPLKNEYGSLTGLAVALVILLIVAVVSSLTLLGCYAYGRATCHQEGHQMHYATQYHLMSGCYLNVDGQWVPDTAYMNNQGN